MTDASIADRQVSRAWTQHDPLRALIPSSVWRQVRQFKRELEAPAARIHEALADAATTKRLMADFVKKRSTGRARALTRLKKRFAGAEFVVAGDCFEIPGTGSDKIRGCRRADHAGSPEV